MLEIVDQIRAAAPRDIKDAADILEKRQEILDQATGEVKRLRQKAEEDSKRLVDESHILDEATQRSQQILTEAHQRAKQIALDAETTSAGQRDGADEYVRNSLRNLEADVQRILNTVQQGISALESKEEASSPPTN